MINYNFKHLLIILFTCNYLKRIYKFKCMKNISGRGRMRLVMKCTTVGSNICVFYDISDDENRMNDLFIL